MPRIDRRQLIQGLSAAPLLAGARPDAIGDENKRLGTTDWQLTYTKVDPPTRFRSPLIEGYAGRAGVRPGERIDLFVSTNPASRFVIDLYRLGYYQGKGGRHVLRLGPFAGKVQPTGPASRFSALFCPCSRPRC